MVDWGLTESYDYEGRSIRYGQIDSGPPVVLVHGTPWSSFNLRDLIRLLSSEYTVYFFDFLATGSRAKQGVKFLRAG